MQLVTAKNSPPNSSTSTATTAATTPTAATTAITTPTATTKRSHSGQARRRATSRAARGGEWAVSRRRAGGRGRVVSGR
ncbi:unnamed protein product [Closterium sp. NIES-54]